MTDDLKHLAKDLTTDFPRSPRETLAGYVIAARMLDKCRAVLADTAGEYHFDCPLDNQFLGFTGIEAEQFKAFVATGATDAEVAAWIEQHSKIKDRAQVVAWNNKLRATRPCDMPIELQEFLEGFRAMSEELTAATAPREATRRAASSPASRLSDPKTWVEEHGNYLFRYALIRVRNETVAEDLVQDTLLAAFQGKERFSGQSTERSWLTGILKHKILDHFRRQARERTVLAEDALPPELEGRFDDLGLWKHEPETGPADWGADAGAQMERKEFMVALKQCLAKLPPRCADAFVLREMEATDSERIQEVLGISPANFWVLLHRARMQLRLCLEQNWLKL